MPTKTVSLVTAAFAVTLLLAGCAGTDAEPGAAATPGIVTTTGPDATATPLPTTTPPAPSTAEAHEAPPAWDACVAAVRAEYPDLPPLDDVWAYEEADVRDSDSGAVAEVRFGHLADGRVEAAFTCQISGTPESPVVDLVSPVDV
ncbi:MULTISPECIES: hypothetical protein [unclassified Frigoribacterium]|uniref:hypothetical protein n=1 Tax=unclassified Frigoribacterium TaxID=2627005 RepID=UPI000F492F17|nr:MULTISPECIES: hypothetical protein [unclassified Frigoribacterium]ROP75921.1 hypothetical protein EDF18_2553 [Frigoribacterium sp. PhB107]TDT64479.1 hypothetical protein EDF20_1976 [Frigoribacterium sp. PhB116]